MNATASDLIRASPPDLPRHCWSVLAPDWASRHGFLTFLGYLYKGELPECLDTELPVDQGGVTLVCELLRLASFYDVPNLIQHAEIFMAYTPGVAQLTNLVQLLEIAVETNANQLKRHVIWRARDSMHIVRALPEWETLPEDLQRFFLPE